MIFSKNFKRVLLTVGIFITGFTMCMPPVYGAQTLTKSSIEVYSDKVFKENMEKYKIPGAVITVVKDGKIILSKGYGYSDLTNKEKVTPSQTMFRIASVTKLFTATAAMQLVDDGKVVLDKPINEYLQGFKLPQDYKTPITLKHLLTHTSGLDDTVIGDLAKKPTEVKSLTEFYKGYRWKSVREPGTIIQYNNRGMGAVGAIIEQRTGMSCKMYMQQNIFNPLKMQHTSLALDDKNLSKAYTYNVLNKKIKEEKLVGYFNVYPVGGILSTSEDMAHFMMAHLNRGIFEENTLLSPENTQNMQARQAGFNKNLPGNTYGFHELYLEDMRILEHSGYSPDGFLTELALIPKQNIGIFIAVNQGSNNTLPQDYLSLFAKHYFPSSNAVKVQPKIDKSTAKQVEGMYRSSDYSQTDLCKGDLIGAGKDVAVKANVDGSVIVTETVTNYFDLKRRVISWKGIEIEPYTYKNTEKNEYIAFKENSQGKVSYMSKSSDSSMAAYERIRWYDTDKFQTSLFCILLILAFIEVLIWLIILLIQGIKYILKKKQNTGETKWGQNLAGIIPLLNLGFYIISLYTWGARMHYGVPFDVKLDLIMLLIATLLTPVLGVLSITYWKNRVGKAWVRINISLTVFIAIAFIWFNHYWNFIGFNY